MVKGLTCGVSLWYKPSPHFTSIFDGSSLVDATGLIVLIGDIACLLLLRDYDYHWDTDLVVYRFALVAAA